jgi:hypothetical protein
VRTPSWQTRIEDARLDGYLTSSASEGRAYHAWEELCRTSHLPFVHVRLWQGRATVMLWMTPTGRILTPAEQGAAWAFDYQGGKVLAVRDTGVDVINVPETDAHRVATFFLRLAE